MKQTQSLLGLLAMVIGGCAVPESAIEPLEAADSGIAACEGAACSCPGAGCRTHVLSVLRDGDGAGTVVSEPAGIQCGSRCTAEMAAGQAVTLTATADASSRFAGWGGACAGAGPCSVTLNSDTSVIALFEPVPTATFPLTVTRAGDGTGTVTSTPAGIQCGTACSMQVAEGTAVTLTATAGTTSTFSGWSGACIGTGACKVTMSQARTVRATFAKSAAKQYLLTVYKSGAGSGVVTSNPPGLDCGSTCAVNATEGMTVTLTATPDTGSSFTGWSGACGGSGACVLTMNSAKTVTATFAANAPSYQPLTVAKAGSGDGTVTSNPPGLDCGTTCSVNALVGATVSLTATPAAGSTFAGWSGACVGLGSCTITMSSPKNVTATFAATSPTYHVLTVTKAGSGSGTVTSNPPGLNCGSTCSVNVVEGTTVVLTAAAASSSTFVGWSGACSGAGTCTLTMTTTKAATATFNPSQTYCSSTACTTSANCCTTSPYCSSTFGTPRYCRATCGAGGNGCGTSLDCCAGNQCVNGTCYSLTACQDTPCTNGGDCCPAAAYCGSSNPAASSAKFCRTTCSTIGHGCAASSDCCSGYACQNGSCVSTACTGNTCSTSSTCCGTAPYCVTGYPNTSLRVCANHCGSVGNGCGGNSDCCSGLTCQTNTLGNNWCSCAGKSCTTNSNCCSTAQFCTNSQSAGSLHCSNLCGSYGWRCAYSSDCCAGFQCDGSTHTCKYQ